MNGSADFIKELTAELCASNKLDSDVVAVLVERLLASDTPKKKVEDVVLAVQTIANKRASK